MSEVARRNLAVFLVAALAASWIAFDLPPLEEASANPGIRSKTVAFQVGTFSSNGSTNAKSFNAQNTLPDAASFTFQLAETGVTVEDAFVEWTVHFNTIGAATQLSSLFMRFDACQDPCTANAWAGTGAAAFSATADYFSNSGEADVASFRQDVSGETQLAAYTGGPTLRAQFGYCLGTAATCTGAAAITNEISYVTGVLYVTYTYDDTSASFTNTVIYPLESTASGDSGSRRVSQAAGCTLGTNCPTFTYNFEAPEAAAGNRLSQWFDLSGGGNSANATDYVTTARIDTGVASGNHVFDETKSANDFGFGFTFQLAGYVENATQTLERTGTGNAMFTLGGEVWETYAASSTAAVKTRTLVVPLGELCAQQVTTKCSASVAIGFPETGVTVKKMWTRASYTVANTTQTTLTLFSKVGANTETSRAYSIAPMGLGIVHLDVVYDVTPSADYATLSAATEDAPVTVTISSQYAAARGATSAELLITYTYTGETEGYLASQTLFAGTSNTDNNKASFSAAAGLVAPVIPESINTITFVAAGLKAEFFGVDSDGALPADHGGTANTQMAIGAAIATGTCTAALTLIPDSFTESNSVRFNVDVVSLLAASTTQAYTPCYADRSQTADTTGGFQVSGSFTLAYQVVFTRFTQNYFRFYTDNSTITPSDPWPAGAVDIGENTAITLADDPPANGERLRLRIAVGIDGTGLPTSSQRFILEFGSTTSTCGAIASWTQVGSSTSTAVWRGFDASPANGVAVGANPPNAGELKLSVSDRAGTYQEQNPSALNPYAVNVGEHVEYDWLLQDNGASPTTTYCFRLVQSAGTPFSAYAFYPMLTTSGYRPKSQNWRWFDDEENETPAAGLGAENVAPADIANQNSIKLRITLKDTAGIAGTAAKFRLQFSEYSDFSAGVGDVAAASACTGNSLWCYADGGGADNVKITTKVLSDSDACSGSSGNGCGTHNEAPTSTSTLAPPAGAAVEFEFTIKHAGARANAVYFFRPYDVTNDRPVFLNDGETYPSLTTQGATLTFTVSGLGAGTSTAGVVTSVTSTAVAVPFGSLPAGTSTFAAQRFAVTTNATQGYQLFVFVKQALVSSGDQIAPVGAANESPLSWALACAATSTGCYGYHTSDAGLSGGGAFATRFAAADSYARFETSTKEIAFSPFPVATDTNDLLLRIQITNNQSAGDYASSLVYLAVPQF